MAAVSNKLFGTARKAKTKKELTFARAGTIESPSMQSPLGVASQGLCKKLVLHQSCIMEQVEIITNCLEPGSEAKRSSYGSVVTELLVQLDSAISITQKCLTRDVYERNTKLKQLLKDNEGVMYANVALLVKWADFAGRDPLYSMNNESIFFCVRAFKDALNAYVRLVAENTSSSVATLPNHTPSQLSIENNRFRRASTNDVLLHRIDQNSNDMPTIGGGVTYSIPGSITRSISAKQQQLTRSHDSLNSDSSDSDVTNNRRSGSNDRHECIDGNDHTPNHTPQHTPTRHPIPNGSHYVGHAHPLRREFENGTASNSYRHVSGSAPLSNITNGDSETPPPLPIKKRHKTQMVHTSPIHSSSFTSSYLPPVPMRSPNHGRRTEETPPPLPIKKRNNPSMANISLTGSLPLSIESLGPPLPIRLDSIDHTIRDRLTQGTPPEKPPRLFEDSGKLLQLIDRYNESIKTKQLKEGEAPPIPLKRKKLQLASQYLFKFSDYTFDDSSIPSLNIHMTAPPPLPPKKRRTRQEVVQPQDHTHKDTNTHVNGTTRRKEGSVGSQDEVELSSDELDPVEETVNFLEVDDVTPYLKFEEDDKGGYTLLGGPLDALIAYAASTSSSVKQYTEAFLSTYYTLISSDELIFKLLIRLQYFYKEGNAPLWQATTSLLVRVLNSMKTLLIKEAEITLIELLHNMLRDGQLKFAQLVRNGIIEKLNQKIPEFIPLSKAMCSNSKSTRVVTDFDAHEVAKQLTILDADYFSKVDIQEMLFWAKYHDEEKCPKLTMFTTHFNDVSQWCQTRLLEKDLEWKKREKLMVYFINVMKALREYNNFNSYLAILSAIESANISRLDWSDKIIRSLEEPRALIDSRGSFKNYRQAFATTKPPHIPYIGLYLQDLTFLEEQPTKLDDKICINFGKRWKQFKSVDHIRSAQTKAYILDVDPAVMGVFNGFKDHENNEDLYKRSLQIKPRKTAAQ